jgi:hypothetical protein
VAAPAERTGVINYLHNTVPQKNAASQQMKSGQRENQSAISRAF